MYLPMPPARTTLANFFSPLVDNFEQMFLTGKETYPLERTLLTTGLTAAGVESLFQQQARYETPHLAIRISRRRLDVLEDVRPMKRIAIVTDASTATCRTRSTSATASWSAIPGTAPGTSRT